MKALDGGYHFQPGKANTRTTFCQLLHGLPLVLWLFPQKVLPGVHTLNVVLFSSSRQNHLLPHHISISEFAMPLCCRYQAAPSCSCSKNMQFLATYPNYNPTTYISCESLRNIKFSTALHLTIVMKTSTNQPHHKSAGLALPFPLSPTSSRHLLLSHLINPSKHLPPLIPPTPTRHPPITPHHSLQKCLFSHTSPLPPDEHATPLYDIRFNLLCSCALLQRWWLWYRINEIFSKGA